MHCDLEEAIEVAQEWIDEDPAERCLACVKEREAYYGHRACEDHESGPDDEDLIDRAYPWRPGFIGS